MVKGAPGGVGEAQCLAAIEEDGGDDGLVKHPGHGGGHSFGGWRACFSHPARWPIEKFLITTTLALLPIDHGGAPFLLRGWRMVNLF